MLESMMSGVKGGLQWIVERLPDSPFQTISTADVSPFFAGLNWIFPIAEMVAVLQLWCTAVAVYYVLSVVMRWIKVIS